MVSIGLPEAIISKPVLSIFSFYTFYQTFLVICVYDEDAEHHRLNKYCLGRGYEISEVYLKYQNQPSLNVKWQGRG